MIGTNFFTPNGSNVEIALADGKNDAVFIKCAAGSLPSNVAGYAIGCIAIATDTGVIYSNTGTALLATFTASSTASAMVVPSAVTDATVNTTQSLGITAASLTTGAAYKATIAGATTGSAFSAVGNTANFTTGGSLFKGDMVAATAGNGLTLVTTGIYTGTGLVTLTATAATTGVGQFISMAGLTSGFGIRVLGGTALTTGSLVRLDMGAATAGNGLSVVTTGVYTTGATALISATANSATTATGLSQVSGTGLTSGANTLLTGGGANMTAGGRVLDVEMGAATIGIGVQVLTSGTYTGTGFHFISGLAVTTGILSLIKATAATLTTGRYLSCNDAATEVFGIGANGHVHSKVSAAPPTIAVTVEKGITAAAITAGGSDTCGIITTTGTNDGTGVSTLQVTFGKTYTTAPKAVILTPRNAAAAKAANTSFAGAFVSGIAATTFDITIPADAAAVTTPSWNYVVIA